MRHTALTAVLACALALAAMLAGCKDTPSPQRRQQTVKLLPDTPPPPPPPPPKPEDKPPPKPEDKPAPQDVPKPQEQPQAQALKEEGPAGNGPGNGLGAGAVTQDYRGGQITAPVVGGNADAGPNRLAVMSFANAATKSLNEYLARHKDVKRLDYQVRVDLWLSSSGAFQRAELVGSSGDPQTDAALRAALDRFPGTGQALPPRMPQPLRVLVSNRMMG